MGERLESRTPLAVTADIVGSDWIISLGAAGDRAALTCDGSSYVVSGTGLRSAVAVPTADVAGGIVVRDASGARHQSFVIAGNAPFANPLRVDVGVESTTIAADFTTVGGVEIGSPRTRLSGRIAVSSTATGVQFGGAVILDGPTTISVESGQIIFAGTVDGPHRLFADTEGLTVFAGAVGARKPLAALATDRGGATILAGPITTNGRDGQVYGDAVVIAEDLVSTAGPGAVAFRGTIDSSPEKHCSLEVRSTATIFGGAVGSITPLAAILTGGRGTTVIDGESVTTAAGGRQTYRQAVRISRDTILNACDGDIRFAGTVDGTDITAPSAPIDLVAKRRDGRINLSWTAPAFAGGGAGLTTVTTGLTSYDRAVGGTVPLQSVSRDRATFAKSVRTITVTDYVIESSGDGGETWRTLFDGVSKATTAAIHDRSEEGDLLVRVRGVNAGQIGDAGTITVDAAPALTFQFVFDAGSEYWSPEARQALEATASFVASHFVVPAPLELTLRVTAEHAPASGILAWANSDLVDSGPGFFRTVVQEKILTGHDPNGTLADGEIHWNFGHSFSIGEAVGSTEYDFRAIVMHEVLHAFGFLSALVEPGENTHTTWVAFDRFIVNADGAVVIDPNAFQWNTSYDPNLTGGNGGLYFGGPNAVAVFGGPVPLLTTDPVRLGSSFSHLDDYTFVGGDEQLMNAFKYPGPGIRVISPVERAILRDLGYVVAPS